MNIRYSREIVRNISIYNNDSVKKLARPTIIYNIDLQILLKHQINTFNYNLYKLKAFVNKNLLHLKSYVFHTEARHRIYIKILIVLEIFNNGTYID